MDVSPPRFPGLMMERPLLLKSIIEHAERYFAGQDVVSYRGEQRTVRSVGETIERARRLASSLERRGVSVGDRVATFGWNTAEHLELYIAVPAMGAVLHPINIRISEHEISYILEHASDKMLFLDSSLAGSVPASSSLHHRVVFGGSATSGDLDYETLIEEGDPTHSFPELSESSAATMCYTSGTTGKPKAVLYSHRSTALHTILQCLPDLYGFRESDVVLPVVPMFHANAWGLPYAALMVGARIVLPGDNTDARVLAEMMAVEQVTFSAAITTIWHAVAELDPLPDLSSLREVIAGGAPLGTALLDRLDALGIPVIQGYGMTEVNPLLSVGRPPARHEPGSPQHQQGRLSQGRPMPFVEAAVDETVGGELMLRGNTVARGYYDAEQGVNDRFTEDGWMRTGDIVRVDDDGLLQLMDRTKDLVKSGGEWISSVQLEHALATHPAVLEACVVAVPDDRWGERPYAFVVARSDTRLEEHTLRAHLADRVPKWWIPDRIEFRESIAKTSVGKLNKKELRAELLQMG